MMNLSPADADTSFQRLARSIRIEGIGLHSGRHAVVHLNPIAIGDGFRINGAPVHPHLIIDDQRATSLMTPIGPVSTVEHLFAALAGCRVVDIDVRVEGAEIPILDGSAAAWYDVLAPHLIPAFGGPQPIMPSASILIEDDDRSIRLDPADSLTLEVTTDFPGVGRCTVSGGLSDFATFMNARTFGFVKDHEHLKAHGLAHGASLDNVLVFNEEGKPMNPSQVPAVQEVARHKWIDLLGDLATVGRPLAGTIRAMKPGHRLNIRLARALINATDE